jgi:hypothetical protein
MGYRSLAAKGATFHRNDGTQIDPETGQPIIDAEAVEESEAA